MYHGAHTGSRSKREAAEWASKLHVRGFRNAEGVCASVLENIIVGVGMQVMPSKMRNVLQIRFAIPCLECNRLVITAWVMTPSLD